jgi:hypothetical protein
MEKIECLLLARGHAPESVNSLIVLVIWVWVILWAISVILALVMRCSDKAGNLMKEAWSQRDWAKALLRRSWFIFLRGMTLVFGTLAVCVLTLGLADLASGMTSLFGDFIAALVIFSVLALGSWLGWRK